MKVVKVNGLDADACFKEAVNVLFLEVFGLSLRPWQELGVWGDEYVCYTAMEGDTAISNVSVLRLNLLVNGLPMQAIQIGGVATKQDYRGRGFARGLMERALLDNSDTPVFLFGNAAATGFYPKFGFFGHLQEQLYLDRARAGGWTTSQNCAVPERVAFDDPRVARYIARRRPLSTIFDYECPISINWFHLCIGHQSDIWELPELDALVVMSASHGVLTIHEVFTDRPFNWGALERYLPLAAIDRIDFEFSPDWLGIPYKSRQALTTDTLFVMNGFAVPRRARIPAFIVT